MQRIIKFRGKRVDNGEWVYGDLYQERKPFQDEITDVFIVEWRKDLCLVSGAPSNNHWWRKVDPETVGQFTGLTDKNNSGSCDIYEGDCVSLKGIVIGNIYEKMDKGEPYIIIPKITSRDWVSTYEILLDSGCEMPK